MIEPECLLEAVSGTIRRLRELTASDRAQFEASYLQPIQNLAHLVHLLPASASEHYSGSGGLFRLCVDLAFYALQSADGKIFTPNDSVEQRHKNEPRWRYATFQAALSCQVFRSLTLMTVTNDRGEEWPRFTTTLYEWLRQSCATRYYVKWHQPSNITGAEGAAVLAKVTPKERMDWLAQGDVQIVRDMHQVAMGASHQSDSIMANVMSTIVRRVIDMDESTRRSRYGLLTVGMHAEPYVLDAMRDAIESGIWKVNQVGSPVWYGSDGLFIEWPAGHSAVLAHFERNGLRGMPRSSISLAEILGKSGVVISAESGLWVRDVMVPMEQGGPRTRRSTALRFVDAQAIFGHMPVEHTKWPYGAELVTAEMQAGVNLQPEKPDRPSKATPAMQPAPDVPQTEPKDQPARASQNQAAPETPSVPSTAPAPTAAAEHPAPVDPDTGEIIYADLIKPEARRWIKSSDIAETVGQMIQLQKAHRGEIVKGFSYGVALSVDWIGDQSPTDITQFVKVFETNRWLGRPSGAKNEAVKLHEIQFDDALKKAIVLSVQGAQTLGFDTGARK
ncbi:MAG: MobH family relaxase [Pseudomonas sp.]